ncbi:unnamed protein product [Dicrocoelium dendriticum]|nr:unnamed protein product [Dicrocoelium dendriticum]
MMVFQDPDTTGILTHRLMELTHDAALHRGLKRPLLLDCQDGRRVEDCLRFDDADIVIVNFATAVPMEGIQIENNVIQWMEHVSRMQMKSYSYGYHADDRVGCLPLIILLLPNREHLIHQCFRYLRWHSLSRFTLSRTNLARGPTRVYLNPTEAIHCFVTERIAASRGLQFVSQFDTVLQFIADAWIAVCSRSRLVPQPPCLTGHRRPYALLAALQLWIRLQQHHSDKWDRDRDLSDGAQKGHAHFKGQLEAAALALEESRRLHQQQTTLWIPLAEENFAESEKAVKRTDLAVKQAELLTNKLRGTLTETLKAAEMEFTRSTQVYQEALSKIYALSTETLDEIRSYITPPRAVKTCVYTICMLFDEEERLAFS